MDDSTDQSLLRRVRNRNDSAAWREFFALYQPMLVRYARMRGLSQADAEDVAQNCMHALSKNLRSFDYSRSRGRFKSFVWTLANNAIANMFRRRRPRVARTSELAKIKQPDEASREAWDQTWLREHLRCCLRQVETRFAKHTIAAFKLYAIQQRPIEEVCRQLDLSPNQVHQAKSRVTQRLRAEMRRLIGDVS